VSEKAEDTKMAFLRLAGTNERTDKIWSGIEARLIDIKHALADQTEETHRYVFAVPKTRIESLRGLGLRCSVRSSVSHSMEERLVDIKHALTDQTEETQRYVFGVARSRIESLQGRFPKFTPENLFEQALNEDKIEICEYVLDGLKMPYKIEFRGARCWLPIPRLTSITRPGEESVFGVKSPVFQWVCATDKGSRRV
jgi:hypothetical protein